MEVITIKDTTIQKEKIVEGKSWLDRDNFILRAFYVNIQVRYFSFITKKKLITKKKEEKKKETKWLALVNLSFLVFL